MSKTCFWLGYRLVLLICFCFPSAARGQIPTTYTGWQREYAKCFDINNDLVPSQVETVKKFLTEALHDNPNDSFLLWYWANLTTQTADWKSAEEANLKLLHLKKTNDYVRSAHWNLAGISAAQGQWSEFAVHSFLWSVLGFRNNGLPAFCVALLWLLLEISIRKNGQGQFASRSTIKNLLLLACLPVLFTLFWDAGRLLNSLLLFGNVGAAFASGKRDSLVSLALSIEWAMISLFLARQIKKRWLAPSPDATEPSATCPNDSKTLSAMKSLAVVFGGLVLLDFFAYPAVGDFIANRTELSSFLFRTSHSWSRVAEILSVVILSPIAQEVLFRGALFPYVKQAAGRSCGFIFSSIIFAGIHPGQSDRFAMLVFVGLVFCLQTEARSRLSVPIVTHSISNFALFLLSRSS